MRLLILAALFHAALSGNINIRMPYLNPAGVTYVDSSAHAGLAAGPLAYTTATARPFATPLSSPLAAPLAAPFAYGARFGPVAQPFAAPVAPVAHHVAPVAHHLAYQAPLAYQPVTKYAAVPTVQHVHGVADVPVTRYEAQPAVIQKALDVAKPAIKTRKYEIRRPAIQKQFYDIEERVIVRPAGSALVELDEPTSKTQKGAAVVSPLAYAYPTVAVKHAAVVPAVHAAAVVPAYKTAPLLPAFRTAAVVPTLPAFARYQPVTKFAYSPYGFASVPTHFQLTQPQLVGGQSTTSPSSTTPAPAEGPEQPQNPYPFEPVESSQSSENNQGASEQPQQPQQSFQPMSDDNDDSVSVDNPEFSGRSAVPEPNQNQDSSEEASSMTSSTMAPEPENSEEVEARPMPEARSVGDAPLQYSNYDLIPQARSGPSIVPSLRNLGPEISQANQQRLIELFTARGGVTEVGLGRAGPAVSAVGEAGQVRARVLSATPAPSSAEPAGERVNTRRVVVSRPIETLQEIEVQEPVTKLERIHVNHPTFIKTARQDIVRVPTSVPVYGKALAPVAHAAVPVAHAAVPFAHAAVPAYSPYYG